MAKDDQPTKDNQKPQAEAVEKDSNHSSNTPRYLAIGAISLVVLALVFSAGMAAQRHHNRMKFADVGFGGPALLGGRGEMGKRHFGGEFLNKQQMNATILSGKITAINGNDFTLDQNGSTTTVKTDSNTRFVGIGISGLKSGDTVTVSGTANSDGSVQSLTVGVTSNT